MAATKITTPRCTVAGYTALVRPALNFNKDGEEYKITIAMEGEAAVKFQAEMEALRDAYLEDYIEGLPQNKQAIARKTIKVAEVGKPELDEDTAEETGRILFTFKQTALITGVSRKTGKPYEIKKKVALFDAKGAAIKGNVRVGSGSVVKVSFEPNPYYTAKDKEVGISFNRLQGVQILKLVEFEGGQASASDMGFGEEDVDPEDAFYADAYVADEGADLGDEGPGGEDLTDF